MKQFVDSREYNQVFVNKQFRSYSLQTPPYRYAKIKNGEVLVVPKLFKGLIQGTVIKDLGSHLLISLHLLSSPIKSDDTKVIISKYEFLTNNCI